MYVKNTTLDDLSAVIGFSATIRLSLFFGGRNMWIPQTASEKSVIAGLVGVPAMTRLVAEFGEGKIAMPTLKNIVLDCRNAKLLGMMQKGTCDHDLVDVAAISRRRLQQLRKEFSAIGLL